MTLALPSHTANWRRTGTVSLPIITDLSGKIAMMERMGELRLPDLRRGSILQVASDYAGQDPSLTYNVIAFVVTDHVSLSAWNKAREHVRARYLPNGEHIEFKKLRYTRSYQAKVRALRPFLRAADVMDGVCVAVAIHKNLKALPLAAIHRELDEPEIGTGGAWDVRTLERAKRATHLVSMFVAGLFDPRRPVWWVTDNDDMIANRARGQLLAEYWGSVLGLQAGGSFRKLDLVLSVPVQHADPLAMEDLLAIPDLVAGAFAETLTDLDRGARMPTQPGLMVAIPPSRKGKVDPIIDWLADDTRPLRRVLIAIRPTDKPGIYAPDIITVHMGPREGVPPIIVPMR